MTPAQIRIVRQSFERAAPSRQNVANLFYANLFEVDPTFRLLLSGHSSARGEKLMEAVGVMVENLHRPHMFIPALEVLAVRHFGYGLEQAHYAVVRAALVRTVRDVLGPQATTEIEEAWAAAYDAIAAEMVAAAPADFRLAA